VEIVLNVVMLVIVIAEILWNVTAITIMKIVIVALVIVIILA
jgi:hypothetical protein